MAVSVGEAFRGTNRLVLQNKAYELEARVNFLVRVFKERRQGFGQGALSN